MIGAELADAAVELVQRLRQLECQGVTVTEAHVLDEAERIGRARTLRPADTVRLAFVGLSVVESVAETPSMQPVATGPAPVAGITPTEQPVPAAREPAAREPRRWARERLSPSAQFEDDDEPDEPAK